MSNVSEILADVSKLLKCGKLSPVEGISIALLVQAVRQEERDKIDALLREYEVHDFTSCYGGEPTWIVALKGDDLSGSHTLYSSPIDALLSKETK